MFGNYSISRNLVWTNMLVCGAALFLACGALIGAEAVIFRQSTIYNLSIQAQMAGSNAVSALLFDDQKSAENTLATVQASPNIISAGILRLNGRLFASYFRDAGGKSPDLPSVPAGQTETYRTSRSAILLVRSITFQGKPTGIIYIESDTQRLYARLKLFAAISILVLAASLLAALIIAPIFQRAIAQPIVQLAETAQLVSRQKNYSVRVAPIDSRNEIAVLVEAFNEMLSQIQQRDSALQKARDELEERVQLRTTELNNTNKELEAFSYSVSHDLRAPLRAIDGFSQALLEDYGETLDSAGQGHLQRVRLAAQRMSTLIDDLLNLSRVTRSEIHREKLDLSAVVRSVADELHSAYPDRNVSFVIAEGVVVEGDSRLLRVVVENLLGNAWKYTSSHSCARIEFGVRQPNGHPTFFVRDDGAGFDPRYSERLFRAFERLHTATEFPGSGIGLATVQRIIRKHGGEIWAEGAVDKGATFYFTL